jgi:hypothetical protein
MVDQTSGSGGLAFLDEDDEKDVAMRTQRDETISKYKAQLRQEYEDEMKRK